MIRRCEAKTAGMYYAYGARGISVCPRWRRGEEGRSGYECFLEDMGPRPEGKSLDRINNDGDYEPDNCRWASKTEQANNKRNNSFIVLNGERLPIAEACRRSGVPVKNYRYRIWLGWSQDRALTTPFEPRPSRKATGRAT